MINGYLIVKFDKSKNSAARQFYMALAELVPECPKGFSIATDSKVGLIYCGREAVDMVKSFTKKDLMPSLA